ncbi:MAG: Mth938-like domain-containing protein [Pseudomonadota bacterium]
MRAGIEMRAAHFPGRASIDAYGNGGFRFADMSHQGSILMLPSGIYAWNVQSFADVTMDTLSEIVSDADDIEVLLFGCGSDLLPVPKALKQSLGELGIRTEPMSTGAAVRTYNVLMAEDRQVAAALIAVDEAKSAR